MKFYVVDAFAIAKETGMGSFINMIMQTTFFRLADVLPFEEAIELLKKSVRKMFAKKGDEVSRLYCCWLQYDFCNCR
jgi:pyruvate-ferredoxin/flavodoxin oxidoreductase